MNDVANDLQNAKTDRLVQMMPHKIILPVTQKIEGDAADQGEEIRKGTAKFRGKDRVG